MTTNRRRGRALAEQRVTAGLQLVPRYVDIDTVSALEGLLERARNGDVIGLAWMELMPRHSYSVHAVGECIRNLTLTRGGVCAIDDELRKLIEERAEAADTAW